MTRNPGSEVTKTRIMNVHCTDDCVIVCDLRDVGIPACDGRTENRIYNWSVSDTVGSYVIYFQPTPAGIVVARVLHGSRDHYSIL